MTLTFGFAIQFGDNINREFYKTTKTSTDVFLGFNEQNKAITNLTSGFDILVSILGVLLSSFLIYASKELIEGCDQVFKL